MGVDYAINIFGSKTDRQLMAGFGIAKGRTA
jgi:hypothetical protein